MVLLSKKYQLYVTSRKESKFWRKKEKITGALLNWMNQGTYIESHNKLIRNATVWTESKSM